MQTTEDGQRVYISPESERRYRAKNGMMQGKSVNKGWVMQGNKAKNEKRIHPTQKPVNLYRWIVQKYIQPGWKLLDTHVGSASSLIAYEEAGIRYVGCEIDSKRYQAAKARLEAERAQYSLVELYPEVLP